MTGSTEKPVTVDTDGDIAVITIDNPPVNAISQAVRQGLKDAVAEIEANEAVRAAVLVGAGRAFIAGADVREFGKPPMEPFLPDVVAALEGSKKPIVAAIQGVALGGGLEVAFGCHYRVAGPGARLGFPEVNLGIIPGAGGTQRLPRLVGVEKAVDLVSSGRQVGAKEAKDMGLVDELAAGDPREAALAFARAHADEEPRRLSELPVRAPAEADFFDTQAAAIARRARGQESPVRALEAVKAAVELPFAEGLKRERAIFQELRGSDQAKALRHAFFAERAVAKVPGLEDVKPRRVDAIGIVGGGTMGAGIAVACLRAGYAVTMVEADEAAVQRGQINVDKNLEGFVARGRMSDEQKAEMLERFEATEEYGALAGCELVIEAVFEDMDVKKTVFAELDAVAKSGAVIATNTSYLDINEIATATKRPADVLGLHFFSPAQIMRLLEIVRADATADDAIATGFEVAKKLGKVGVLSGVCDGFIGNRILAKYRKQADYMIEDGAMPWDVDAAMEAFGFPMGPFRVMDLAGLDISWAQRKRTAATRDPDERYVAIADRICEQGWFGQKTGRGWYVYENGKPAPNPDVEKIVLEESERKGIARREIGADEIQNRILYAMVNEGARIVEEGIAARPLDVDVVELFGYGFPRWRGGPMCQADLIGLPTVLEAIRGYAADDLRFWAPAPLLERLVAEGKSFSDLNG